MNAMTSTSPGRGRIAVVTASASGIGLATVNRLVEDGWQVVMSDVEDRLGRAEAERLGIAYRRCDVRDEKEVEALFDGLDPVYLLVNNAGVAGPTAPVWEVDPMAWRDTLEVNITGQFLAARRVLPAMIAAGEGVIVNLASVAGRVGYANRSPYAASKWAVRGLTASLAQEVGAYGVRVNAILPGAVRGRRIEGVISEYARVNGLDPGDAERLYLRRQATGRMIEPDEVAAAVAYLASDEARSVTGHFLGIDGGYQ